MNALVADISPSKSGLIQDIGEASSSERYFEISGIAGKGGEVFVEFGHQILPLGDGNFLRLWQNPTVKLDTSSFELEVVGWDVRVPLTDAVTIPREICRKFTRYWSKSLLETMTDQDRALWQRIVDQVDVAGYAAIVTPPQYVEATLLDDSRRPLIRLSDGQLKRVSTLEAPKLSLINKGELFNAYAKFDSNEEISYIERVALIGDPPTSEEMVDWPPTPYV